MRRVGGADALLDQPVGAFVTGRSFACWVQSPRLFGVCHFGHLDPADQPAALSLFPLLAHPALDPPYDLLHDLGSVESIDASAFAFLELFLRERGEALAQRTRRVAIVRPHGLAGAAFTGVFHEWVAPRFDAVLVNQATVAYEWLCLEPAVVQEIEAVYHAAHQPPWLRDLRAVLATELRGATLASVAERLAMTPRTLQRQLSAVGTTFRNEVLHARLRTAEALLLDTNEKVEVIAREVGFRSAPSFCARFRQLAGVTPLGYRDHALQTRARRPGG